MDLVTTYDIFLNICLVISVIWGIYYFIQKANAELKTKNNLIKSFKEKYFNDKVFICDRVEHLGQNLYQMYGEAHGIDIYPNMKIINVDNKEYAILEVYAADNKPSQILPIGLSDCAIVVDSKDFDYKIIKKKIKSDKIVALKINE